MNAITQYPCLGEQCTTLPVSHHLLVLRARLSLCIDLLWVDFFALFWGNDAKLLFCFKGIHIFELFIGIYFSQKDNYGLQEGEWPPKHSSLSLSHTPRGWEYRCLQCCNTLYKTVTTRDTFSWNILLKSSRVEMTKLKSTSEVKQSVSLVDIECSLIISCGSRQWQGGSFHYMSPIALCTVSKIWDKYLLPRNVFFRCWRQIYVFSRHLTVRIKLRKDLVAMEEACSCTIHWYLYIA